MSAVSLSSQKRLQETPTGDMSWALIFVCKVQTAQIILHGP